jgi:hypothetical protein
VPPSLVPWFGVVPDLGSAVRGREPTRLMQSLCHRLPNRLSPFTAGSYPESATTGPVVARLADSARIMLHTGRQQWTARVAYELDAWLVGGMVGMSLGGQRAAL